RAGVRSPPPAVRWLASCRFFPSSICPDILTSLAGGPRLMISGRTACMKIGLITDSLGHLSFEEALDVAQRLGLHSVEVATGNWSEAPHIDLAAMLASAGARQEFAGKVT